MRYRGATPFLCQALVRNFQRCLGLRDCVKGLPACSDLAQSPLFPALLVWEGLFSMPFGLTVAPLVFTKLLIALVAHLRHQGIFIFPYLDDSLVKVSSPELAMRSMRLTLDCLQRIGFVINERKSSLIPTSELDHLGVHIDTQTFRVSLTKDRQDMFCG